MRMKECRYARHYKGVYPPKCDRSQPCDTCMSTYLQKHGWANEKADWSNESEGIHDVGLTEAFKFEIGGRPKGELWLSQLSGLRNRSK